MITSLLSSLRHYCSLLIRSLIALLFILTASAGFSQINTSGAVIGGGFGVNGGLYSGQTFTTGTTLPPAGTVDWFAGLTGRNIIDTSTKATLKTLLQNNSNPLYVVRQERSPYTYVDLTVVGGVKKKYIQLIDAVWARDHFGGTGETDQTSYTSASKNGEDPAIWSTGPANVLGKNDLIDVAGHVYREVDVDNNKDNTWFVGIINRAEPGGSAYMDFEFFVNAVSYNGSTKKFTSGGPDLGHTAFKFDGAGNITQFGDIIYNVSLENGGTTPGLEVRIWVEKTALTSVTPAEFNWGGLYDGAFNGAPYGYASITPKTAGVIFGYVNLDLQLPLAPPWGTRNTKSNIYTTNYSAYSVSEMALNMTAIGLGNYLYAGGSAYDCRTPWRTYIVKTRASNSFTAQLKDFAGPYVWGQPSVDVNATVQNALLSCTSPTTTLIANPLYADASYLWSTANGNITTSLTASSVVVDKVGQYSVQATLQNNCTVKSTNYTVSLDNSKPPIVATSVTTTSCSGSNGTITLTPTGGSGSFTYVWSGPNSFTSTSKDLTGLAAGTYSVVITDATSGCTKTVSGIIVKPAVAINITPTVTNITCSGLKNGAISIASSGGYAPLSYSWSNGQTVQSLTNVAAGSYTLTVTDAEGCTATSNSTVTQPGAALAASAAKADDTDPNVAVGNGTISLTVTGGTTAYSYAWTGPSSYTNTSKDITALKAGTYNVTVTDANGCTATASAIIYEPEICGDNIDNDNNGLTDCDDVTACKPATPSAITGEAAPCTSQNITYSVTNVGGMTYTWTVPSNATIVSGQGTNSLTVSWTSTVPATISVKASNGTCSSDSVSILVSPKTTPATPTTIIKN